MKTLNSFRIQFPSRSVNESFARAMCACFAAQLDPTLDELGDLKTAVSEAVTNVTVHAYPSSIGEITMKGRILEGGILEITVKDKGVGIEDVKKAREPMFTTGGNERTGMGFTIMESFMESVKVRSAPGKGTVITMRKRLGKL